MTHSEGGIPRRTLHEIYDRVEAQLRAQGHAQGREEVLRANLLLLLERRFGRLREPVLVNIYRAGSETLREWLDCASTADTLGDVLDDRDPDTRTGTAAEQIHAQTRPLGRLRAQRECVTLLLARRFGGLPEPPRDRIWRTDMATLRRWFERGLTAPSLDAVFEGEP